MLEGTYCSPMPPDLILLPSFSDGCHIKKKGHRQSLRHCHHGFRISCRADRCSSSIRSCEQSVGRIWTAAERRSHRHGVWDHRAVPAAHLLRESHQAAHPLCTALLRAPLAPREGGVFRTFFFDSATLTLEMINRYALVVSILVRLPDLRRGFR